MADKLPYRQLNIQSLLTDDVEEFARRLIDPLNQNFEVVATGFENGITLQQNSSATIKSATFTTPSTYTANDDFPQFQINTELPRRAVLCQILRVYTPSNFLFVHTGNTSALPAWYSPEAGVAVIQYIGGLQDSTQYTVDLLFR